MKYLIVAMAVGAAALAGGSAANAADAHLLSHDIQLE